MDMAKGNKKILNLKEYQAKVARILELAEELEGECSELGINAFQPGAMKELKMASLLGHDWIQGKKDADACSREDHSKLYEYLSGTEHGQGQIDRMFKDLDTQHDKYLESMHRIDRNDAFYLAYTNKDTSKPLDILRIYKVDPMYIKEEADRQLHASNNSISHVSFNEKFAAGHGCLVYQKPGTESIKTILL